MIDHPNPLRILLVAFFIIFLVTEGLCRRSISKIITLEGEEDVIVLTKRGGNLKVVCENSENVIVNDVNWKKIKDNRHFAISPNEFLSTLQWLEFVNVSFDDEGQYACTINGSNVIGSTVSEKRNFVLKTISYTGEQHGKTKPKFQKVLRADVPILVNRTLHLNCPFTSTSDTQYFWSINNKSLINRKAIIDGFGAIDNEYSSKHVRLSDTGNYTCVVQNRNGLIQHQFAVVVYDDENKMPPSSTEYPRDLSLKSGARANFFCNAFVYDNKEIDWYFLNGTNPMDIDIETVDLSQFNKMYNNDDVTVVSDMLIIESVTTDDAGWYICVQKGFEGRFMAEVKLDVDGILINVKSEDTNKDENVSGDKHFVLSLLPMLSTLPMDKKLKARIAIETLLHDIAFSDLNTSKNCHAEQKNNTKNSSTMTDILPISEDEYISKKR